MIRRISAIAFMMAAFSGQCAQAQSASASAEVAVEPKVTIVDTKVGTGKEAVNGTMVSVHYTGWFYKPEQPNQHGAKFDSSVDRGKPIEFPLGAGRVIKGWEQGLQGLKVGGKRTIIIPYQLAYGANGRGPIPPASDLVFDVELIDVK